VSGIDADLDGVELEPADERVGSNWSVGSGFAEEERFGWISCSAAKEGKVMTGRFDWTQQIGWSSAEADGCRLSIGLRERDDQLNAGRGNRDMFDTKVDIGAAAAVFADAEQAEESKEDGAPIACIVKGSEVEVAEDAGEIGKRESVRGIDAIELSVDVEEALLDARIDGAARQRTEVADGVPPLESGDVRGKAVDGSVTAEIDGRLA